MSARTLFVTAAGSDLARRLVRISVDRHGFSGFGDDDLVSLAFKLIKEGYTPDRQLVALVNRIAPQGRAVRLSPHDRLRIERAVASVVVRWRRYQNKADRCGEIGVPSRN